MERKRSHTCGTLSRTDIGKKVILAGWVDRVRDHGGVLFVDLRDRSGITQVVFSPPSPTLETANRLRGEWVIQVEGTVSERPDKMKNKTLTTGEIEVRSEELEILSESEPLPFSLHDDSPSFGAVDESLRLKYRYLELRRTPLQRNLALRHRFLHSVRQFYHQQDFWEIETPILYKSTPEGARDFLVPSRLNPGEFFALPQSPQTLKQLCMVGGLERYFQIARCFRDEDLRSDRQPEFTQIDVEMSFIDQEDILALHEQLIAHVWREVLGITLATPFPRIRHADSIDKYGSDKPDLRLDSEILNLDSLGRQIAFPIYRDLLEQGGVLRGLAVRETSAPLSRTEIDATTQVAIRAGAAALGWIRWKEGGEWQGALTKFFSPEIRQALEAQMPQHEKVILFVYCGMPKSALAVMSALREHFGPRALARPRHEATPLTAPASHPEFAFAWITEFPLFEFDLETKRLYAAHHPFTRPHPESEQAFYEMQETSDLIKIKAAAYDLVLNGHEIGGGSLRIFNARMQQRMFQLLGLSEEEATEKFGFFIQALKYGTPPHGGIALGVDRIAMLLAHTTAIRDVIAFPKTQKGSCLMSGCPSSVSENQLRELSLRCVEGPAKSSTPV